MRISDILKKVTYFEGAEIRVELMDSEGTPRFYELDEAAFVPTGERDCEIAESIIDDLAEYTLKEVRFIGKQIVIYGKQAAKRKRTPKEKPETPAPDREAQEQAIRDELERLDRAVDRLVETIAAPFRRMGQRAQGNRGGIMAAIRNARAAVRRILTRIFRKGGAADV